MGHGGGSGLIRRMQRRDRWTGWVLPLLVGGGLLLVIAAAQVGR
jgi:hypothetical protein